MKASYVDEWLASKNHVLWGRAFELTHEDTRTQAAEWFAEQLKDYEQYVNQQAASLPWPFPEPTPSKWDIFVARWFG